MGDVWTAGVGRVGCFCLFLLLAVPAGVTLAGVDDGIAAYLRGDYAIAARELLPAAEAGDVRAQGVLGFMYDDGLGVPHDDDAAAGWYLRAARQGDPVAQENLGIMHADGDGVPRDYVRAFVWFSRAAAGFPPGADREGALRKRERARPLMTPGQVREAEAILAGGTG